jgi:hypothetical protein
MGMGNIVRASLALALTVGISGCSVIGRVSGAGPEAELTRGVAAARAQDYATARSVLEPLYRAHYMDEYGRKALLVLTALELDPRNAERRLYAAADFAVAALNAKDVPDWEVPLAESLYLLSQELGGHEEALARAEAAKQQAQNVAAAAVADRRAALQSNREPWPTQVRKLREANDELKKRADALQAAVRARDKELAEANQELERIKKTLKIK